LEFAMKPIISEGISSRPFVLWLLLRAVISMLLLKEQGRDCFVEYMK
jgi:hypothetical protein